MSTPTMTTTTTPGLGLDCGTMNLVSARNGAGDKKIQFARVRNAFLDLEPDSKRMLKLKKLQYVEDGDKLIVMDDAAFSLANFLKREVRRPLAKGLISSRDLSAQSVLNVLIAQVLRDPLVIGEKCCYSVPAAPVDAPDQDVLYHQEVLRKIIESYGYTAEPFNEAQAVVYSNSEEFSGLAFSFGSGMVNVALVCDTLLGVSFSTTRGGGDWIDSNAARAVGSTPTAICAIKEAGVDLLNPVGHEQGAIATYITAMIRDVLKTTLMEFKKNSGGVAVPAPIPIILSGGTSRAKNFVEVFRREFEAIRKNFPVPVSAVIPAADPMTSVAEGLLTLAMQEDLLV